jgi:hypothetical protein
MRLPEPRIGEEVKVRDRSLPYSFWPTGRTTARDAIQPAIFSSDPWFLIQGVVDDISDTAARSQAEAFRRQARDFYNASRTANIDAAKPLLFYYCVLNLAKCFTVCRSNQIITARLNHGIVERLPTTLGAVHGEISVNPANAQGAFQLFAHELGQVWPTVAAGQSLTIKSQDFLSQILVGHRMLCAAEGIKERFISVEKLIYCQYSAQNEMWLKARFERQDIRRFDYSYKQVSEALGRDREWRVVQAKTEGKADPFYADFELRQLFGYAHRPSDTLNDLSAVGKRTFWQVVTAIPPYRKYYVYVNSPSQIVLHQLLSMYATAYYFGSITRYKPERFAEILDSKIGAFVHEFFDNQQSQFLYLIASEMLRREISRAAVT